MEQHGTYKDIKYFNTTRNYTTALINAFNGIKYWVESENDQKEYTIPISFGNYEKAIDLEDLNDEIIKKGNFNFLPRLVLSFRGMNRNTERQTNKYKKFSKTLGNIDSNNSDLDKIQASYNSTSYDFSFTLLLQTRGLNIATQVTEEILSKFNPSLNLEIKEFPLFDKVETQILISDPEFDINEEMGPEDINLINVSFDVTVRGNIYSPIVLSSRIESLKMFINLWNTENYQDSKLASYYNFDIDTNTNTNTNTNTEILRSFDGTIKNDIIVESVYANEVKRNRKDYTGEQIMDRSCPKVCPKVCPNE